MSLAKIKRITYENSICLCVLSSLGSDHIFRCLDIATLPCNLVNSEPKLNTISNISIHLTSKYISSTKISKNRKDFPWRYDRTAGSGAIHTTSNIQGWLYCFIHATICCLALLPLPMYAHKLYVRTPGESRFCVFFFFVCGYVWGYAVFCFRVDEKNFQN